MHEIITIQLGHRANYLATHFWNAQVGQQCVFHANQSIADHCFVFLKESYFSYDEGSTSSPVNHDVLFRPGLSPSGDETFTPRTVIYDLKGGFGGLRKWGGLYDQQLSLGDAVNEPAAKDVRYETKDETMTRS